MREDIYYLSADKTASPFSLSMSGITYPDTTYHIQRKNSTILCAEYVIDGTTSVTEMLKVSFDS